MFEKKEEIEHKRRRSFVGQELEDLREIQRHNHPAKGSIISVNPIKDLKDIQKVKDMLRARNAKYYAIFVTGINTGLRAYDLLHLNISHLREAFPGDDIVIRESKTKKVKHFSLNNQSYEAVQNLLRELPNDIRGDKYIFGTRGMLDAMKTATLGRYVKGWCQEAGLIGNYSSHTLRKTWGYHQRVTYNVSLPILMVCFNHSSQEETLNYLCIQSEEVMGVYANEI